MKSPETKTIKNGWEDQTVALKEKVKNFIANPQSKNYDQFELHISGMNTDVLTKVWDGTVDAKEIKVFYEKDIPQKINVMYENEGKGQNIDVYISGKALSDFNIIN